MYRTLLTDLTNLLTYPQVVFPTGMEYNVQNFTYRSHQPPHLPPSGFSNWNGKKKLLLWVRRGARYLNVQIVITHALHVYSQHSIGLHSE